MLLALKLGQVARDRVRQTCGCLWACLGRRAQPRIGHCIGGVTVHYAIIRPPKVSGTISLEPLIQILITNQMQTMIFLVECAHKVGCLRFQASLR